MGFYCTFLQIIIIKTGRKQFNNKYVIRKTKFIFTRELFIECFTWCKTRISKLRNTPIFTLITSVSIVISLVVYFLLKHLKVSANYFNRMGLRLSDMFIWSELREFSLCNCYHYMERYIRWSMFNWQLVFSLSFATLLLVWLRARGCYHFLLITALSGLIICSSRISTYQYGSYRKSATE